MTKAQLLADTFDKTRQLTKFYLSKLKEVNPEESLNINGYEANCLYWIAAHLVWAEDYLGIIELGGKSIAPEWAKKFAIKSDGELPEDRPDFKTVLGELKRVHEAAMQHIGSLSDEQLEEQNLTGFHFGDGNASKLMMIQHCIRHEGTHLGQLSLLSKIYGQQTV
jgi:uncharacterized damage-inducible protein DinB